MRGKRKYAACAGLLALALALLAFYASAVRPGLVSEPSEEAGGSSSMLPPDSPASESPEASHGEASASEVPSASEDQLLVDMNTPFLIEGHVYAQGEKREENNNMDRFGFNGDFRIRVESASLYASAAEAEGNPIAMEAPAQLAEFRAPVFLLLELELENLDASFLHGVRYGFHMGIFYLKTVEDFAAQNYRDAYYYSPTEEGVASRFYFDNPVNPDSDSKDYYHFTLREGESMRTRIGFWLEESLAEQDALVLKIGNSYENLFGIRLDAIEDKR